LLDVYSTITVVKKHAEMPVKNDASGGLWCQIDEHSYPILYVNRLTFLNQHRAAMAEWLNSKKPSCI